VSAIYAFFAQVLPSVVGEGSRVRIFIILLLPSALTALAGYRNPALIVFGVALAAGVLGLLATPVVAPLLRRWGYSYWLGTFAADAHRFCSDAGLPPFSAHASFTITC
jgi:hypothetical protein